MKFTKIVAISALCIFCVGCSKTENNDVGNSTTPTKEITVTVAPKSEATPTPIPTETPTPAPLVDEDVNIVIGMISMNSEMTIEQYVDKLKSDEPDGIFAVYDDNHYSITIKESERLEFLKHLLSEDGKNEMFGQLYEQYPGVYLNIEFNEIFSEVKFYVDKGKYDESDFGVALTPLFIAPIYCEYAQAYSLIPVENRDCSILIIDSETKEIIYNSKE